MADGKIKEEDQEPDLPEFAKFYLDAFRELGTCRINGLDMGPIPFTAMVEYSKIWGVEDFEDFHYLIRRMDNKFLSLKSQKELEKGKARGKADATKPTKAGSPHPGGNRRPSRT